MTQCPFLLRLCQEVLLRTARWFFFFSCSFVPEAESECSVCQPAPWMKQAATHSGQTGKNDCCHPAEQVPSDRKHSYFFVDGLPFSRFRWCLFLSDGFLFLRIFLLKFFSTQSASVFVYLHFAPFSEPHQSVIFVLGAKVIPGLDGKARSSLLFSVKISSPAGSILTEKPCIP